MNDTLKTSDMPIEKQTSRNLKRAYNIMHVGSNKLFKSFEVTVAQFDLMETILLSENQSLTIQDLASRTISLQPNITRMVAELESAGFVERSSGADRRIVIVQLTPREGTIGVTRHTQRRGNDYENTNRRPNNAKAFI